MYLCNCPSCKSRRDNGEDSFGMLCESNKTIIQNSANRLIDDFVRYRKGLLNDEAELFAYRVNILIAIRDIL